MLNNTYTLTVDSVDYTLKRIREAGGTSEYLHRGDGFSYHLKIRNSESNQGGQVYNVYNMVLEHAIAATPTVDERRSTASFTGRFPALTDPADHVDLMGSCLPWRHPFLGRCRRVKFNFILLTGQVTFDGIVVG